MKYIFTIVAVFLAQAITFAQQQTVTYSVTPATFNENQSCTITFNGNSINEAAWGVTNNALYLWAWSYDSATNTSMDCPTNGTWTASNAANKLTYNAVSDTYSITFVPQVFFNRTGLSKMGFLLKAFDGTGDKKSQDINYFIGALQFTSLNPAKNSVNFVSNGSSNPINYTTSVPANFVLTINGTPVSTVNNSTTFSYNYIASGDANVVLTATSVADPASVISSNFVYSITPNVQSAAMPGYMRQGINYHPSDPTRVGLAIYAPNKSFMHVIGSFNNWNINSLYVMNRDTANPDIFWIELTGLTPQQVYTFQYRSNDGIKVADPYSRLVLSPDDDPFISSTTYPGLPAYPAGQQFDVSVVQTGMPAYSWSSSTTNFTKPPKQNLIVYEALVRDFTAEKNWQSMIDKLPYLKSLNINAIELMPVMEFDGNSSWGYNTGFHYALDKAYGTPDKFKEFIDKCHQNGLAVILDVALNHATGRSPIERLWANNTSDGGYGSVAANNPYFNQNGMHAYSVFYDFNHSAAPTKYYVNRVLEQWITEYKVDGFRWDLTKGFTQACTASDTNCTDSYQADRVAILKQYADYQWAIDPNSYIIFEHLGSDIEEQQWANYRISEGKGVMMWDKETTAYNQNTMGYATDSNFNRVDFENHGFSERRADSYGESHDEERIMYKNITYGASNGTYDVKVLANALERQKAYGAVFLPVPGPKMIWQFAELGFDKSIFLCSDGTTVNTDWDAAPGDCKLDNKPSAFSLSYDLNAARTSVKDVWAKILNLKLANPVFDTTTFDVSSGNLMPRIYIYNNALPATSLKDVIIIANFDLTAKDINPSFPYTGTWYNLMNNMPMAVTSTTAPITLQPGEFRIFGNGAANFLGTAENNADNANVLSFQITENPASNGIIKVRYRNAKGGVISVYDLSGKLVKTYKTEANNGDQTLSAFTLKSGTYLLQLKSEKGIAVEKLIVK